MKRTMKFALTAGAAAFGLFCITEPEAARDAVSSGMMRCLTTVIPSLYAMMIASGLMLSTGAVRWAGRIFDRPSRIIFGMDGETFACFLFSMIAGYPVGARLIVTRRSAGEIGERYAVLCSGLCFGAGSAFIFGCTSGGWLVLISTAAANILTALLLSLLLRKYTPELKKCRKTAVSAAMLSDAVSSAGRAMGEICFAVTGFSVLTAMLRRLGAVSLAAGLISGISGMPRESADTVICALLDVTAVSGLPPQDMALLPVTAALVSFGGACVFVQISAVFRGKLSILPLLFTRIAAAVLSYGICRLLLPKFISGEVLAVSAMTPQLHSSPSPIPSLMLILMTGALLAAGAPRKDHR